MKLRNGFVSNSSSSSFIIAAKDPNNIKVKIEVDLSKYIDLKFTTETELWNYFKENCCMSDEEILEYNSYKKSLKAIKSGKTVLFLTCSDDCDPIERVLCDNGLNEIIKDDNITIIEGDGGY
jgi:hypothetical protein